MAKTTTKKSEKTPETPTATPAKTAQKPADAKPLIAENTKLTLTIPAQVATDAYTAALKRLAKRLKHPGFRPGKVPPKIAEETLGQAKVIEAALDRVLPQVYQEAVVAAKKQPITQPSISPVSLELGSDWVLEAQIAERPEVSIKGYEKIVSVAKKTAQKDLEKELDTARKAHAEAQKKAKKDLKASDSKKESAAEQPFREPSEQEQNEYLTQRIYQALIKELKPAIPELLVRDEVRYDLDELQHQLEPLKLSIQEYMQKRGITEQQLSSELAARALGRLQLTLLLQEVAKTAKIAVTQEQIDAAITETKNEELLAQRANPQYRNLIEQTLLRKAVAEHLLGIK